MTQAPSAVQWLTLGVAVVVAVITALQFWTARLQWRTANNKAVFDLFNSRYEVYQEFRDIVGKITGAGRADADAGLFVKAREAAERAQFLFGDDVIRYLDEFVNSVGDLEGCGREQDGLQGDELKRNRDQQRKLKDSIEAFRTRGPELFGHYIRFDQPIV